MEVLKILQLFSIILIPYFVGLLFIFSFKKVSSNFQFKNFESLSKIIRFIPIILGLLLLLTTKIYKYPEINYEFYIVLIILSLGFRLGLRENK